MLRGAGTEGALSAVFQRKGRGQHGVGNANIYNRPAYGHRSFRQYREARGLAGTLVPITGFANAVASCALDARGEGFILGVGAKIFTIAGPVILYGTAAGALYGVIYRICRIFF